MKQHPAPCRLGIAPYCKTDPWKIIVAELSDKQELTGSKLHFACANCVTYMTAHMPRLLLGFEVEGIH